jgi:hypothetical protein
MKKESLLVWTVTLVGLLTISLLVVSWQNLQNVQAVYEGDAETYAEAQATRSTRKKKSREDRQQKARRKDKAPRQPRQKTKTRRPPLSSLISDETDGIVGDVRFLLDFAILGHAKCATSFLMKWLHDHPEVQIHDAEVCDLYDAKPALLVKKLYEDLRPGEGYQRGFKCPGHFSRNSMRYFRRYFSKTNLIVGLRHPVRWFERYVYGTNTQRCK